VCRGLLAQYDLTWLPLAEVAGRDGLTPIPIAMHVCLMHDTCRFSPRSNTHTRLSVGAPLCTLDTHLARCLAVHGPRWRRKLTRCELTGDLLALLRKRHGAESRTSVRAPTTPRRRTENASNAPPAPARSPRASWKEPTPPSNSSGGAGKTCRKAEDMNARISDRDAVLGNGRVAAGPDPVRPDPVRPEAVPEALQIEALMCAVRQLFARGRRFFLLSDCPAGISSSKGMRVTCDYRTLSAVHAYIFSCLRIERGCDGAMCTLIFPCAEPSRVWQASAPLHAVPRVTSVCAPARRPACGKRLRPCTPSRV
jgi:hypothetical protein